MTTAIVNGIVDFVEILEDLTHDYQVTINTTTGSTKVLKTCKVFTVGDFVSYEVNGSDCVNFVTFSNEHKIRLNAAYLSARTLNQRALDAKQAFSLYDREDDICNDSANSKNAVNAVAGGVTGFLGLPTVIAGVCTANPFMMMAGAGMLSGTACAIKDTADINAEKNLRRHRLSIKHQEAQEALAQSKRADKALDMLFSRFREEVLQGSIDA